MARTGRAGSTARSPAAANIFGRGERVRIMFCNSCNSGNSGYLWIIIILILLFACGGNGWGGCCDSGNNCGGCGC